tara:strand:+ start:908 stop:1582 length:675 start_codon:yes stop_codon:yes gene_type:complete
MTRESFYLDQVNKYIRDKNAKILVLGAGTLDKKVFEALEFNNVTYSNIENTTERDLNVFENLHDIRINDSKYDYCVAHACIHHSSKPHSAILELYRVSTKGALIIEARDSFISKIACKFKFSEEYELSAVKKNITTGGVDNTNIPNYVFRWTEREILKLLKSYKPELKHKIEYGYGHHIKFSNSKILRFLFKVFFFIFKKQQNLFSIFINKEFSKNNYNDWIKL